MTINELINTTITFQLSAVFVLSLFTLLVADRMRRGVYVNRPCLSIAVVISLGMYNWIQTSSITHLLLGIVFNYCTIRQALAFFHELTPWIIEHDQLLRQSALWRFFHSPRDGEI